MLANTAVPHSAPKNKSQSITYHFIHEGVVRDEWHTAYVSTHDNKAVLLTKLLPSGAGFVQNLLHHIFQSEGQDFCGQLQSGLHYWNHFKVF